MTTQTGQPSFPVASEDQLATIVEEIAMYLTDRMLDVRKRCLPARAGDAQQPDDKYVAKLRASMEPDTFKARPWWMLFWVALTDLSDGIPPEAVAEPFKLAIKFIEQYGAEVRDARAGINMPSLLVPMLAETKAQNALDLAQLTLQANPDDVAAQDRVLDLSAAYREKLTNYEDAVRARRAAVEGKAA